MMMRSLFAVLLICAAAHVEATGASESKNPVSLLSEKLQRGEAKLTFQQRLGYLPSLLGALHIPASSQSLVFSKTSFQSPLIHPQSPRAIYFNDNVYVGYVAGGDYLEIVAVDPTNGPAFYLLEQEATAKPALTRRTDECLQCHQSQRTFDRPGFLMRSVWTGPSGRPEFQFGDFINDDAMPMKNRWGGWYVSGTLQNDVHMGNYLVRGSPELADLTSTSNVTDLNKLVDINRYLTPHSDIVALMVLEHQVEIHNLITQAQMSSREALEQNAALAGLFHLKPGEWTDSTKTRIKAVTEPLVKGLLFRDEYRLKGKVQGTSTFAEEFQKLGPRDSKGRSVRQLDLETRLLKYPCSWLIYSEEFDALPPEVKLIVYRRMYELLNNPDGANTLQILSATKPEFRKATGATD